MTVFLLFFNLSSVLAVDMPDLNGYSNEQIEELLELVEAELENRQGTLTIPAGAYIVDKSIVPWGTYILSMKYTGENYYKVGITANMGRGVEKFSQQALSLSGIKGEGSWEITILTGDLLECSHEIKLTPVVKK